MIRTKIRTNNTTRVFDSLTNFTLSKARARRTLRYSIVWLLMLALCWQSAMPAALAAKRGDRRGKSGANKPSRPKVSPARPPAKRRPAQTNAVNVTTVSAASFESTVAPDSIMAAFGTSLAIRAEAATSLPLPTSLAGTTVTVRDSAGTERNAQLFFVSSDQVNYLIPSDTASGAAIVTIISASGVISQGTIQVNAVGPGIFTANADGRGVPAANLIRFRDGQLIYEPLTQLDPATGRLRPKPIDPGLDGDRIFLVLYLTGLRRAPDPNGDGNVRESVRVFIGAAETGPDYAGPQGTFVGLDQVNVEIPRTLAGRGRLNLAVTINGFGSSNLAEIDFGAAAGIAPPQINGFNPATATAGQTVTINGSGFSATPSENLVRIGALEATVVVANLNQLSVVVPFGAEADKVTVRTPQGESASANNLQIRTSVSGYVETTSRQPLGGVKLTVSGTNITATTGAEGVFILPGVPTGVAVIEVDGAAALPVSSYPRIRLRTSVVANRDNQITRPISLQFAAGASVSLGAAGTVVDESVTVPAAVKENDPASFAAEAGNVIFDLPSGTTVNFPDGSTSGQLVLTQLENSRTPVSLPKGHFSPNILQIAPYGATFSQGGKITFPNTDGYAAGAQVRLFRLDQNTNNTNRATLGGFIEAGLATVSADAKTIETQAGVITESGCYFVSALRATTTLIGRVVDSNGNPVRRVHVSSRGQEALTDGDGAFVVRLAPANPGSQATIDAALLRPTGRVDRALRENVVVAAGGITKVAPALVLPSEPGNHPPAILAPTSLTVAAGQTTESNVAVADQDAGQTVQLSLTGPSFATLTGVGNNAYRLRVAPGGSDAGNFSLRLTATDSAGGSTTQPVSLTITAPPPRITDFNPKRGIVGSTITITGASLKSAFGNPTVTFAGANATRLQAFVSTATATEVKVTAPNGAVTGVIDLANSLGRAAATGDFTVDPSQSFSLAVAPSTATALQGGTGTFVLTLNSPTPNFTQLARLSLAGAPAGATVKFEPEQITAGATSTLSIVLPGATPVRSYDLTVSAKAVIDGNELTRTANVTLAVQASTQTTLSGRVLSTKDEPVPGATVSLDGKSATTDASGSFLLSGITAGSGRPVMVNGGTATVPNRTYPIINEPVDIVAGQANVVPYTFYLPAIDTVNQTVVVPNQTTVVTTPDAPNLALTIPANANLRNRDGSPVTRVSITCVEIDRTPAPLPPNTGTNMVYSAQPGGAKPAPGTVLPVTYPNLAGLNPGTTVDLFAFDHDTAKWYVYGQGRVSQDGRTIVPNPGVGLRDFSWHYPNAAPGGNPSPTGCPTGRTPNTVDLATGVKIETATDISIGGARGGLELTRVYTSDVASFCELCPFGSMQHNYNVRLTGSFQSGGAGRVVMPEQVTGRLFSYVRTEADGTLVFNTTATSGQLADVVRKLTNGTYEYRTGDGQVWRFDSSGRLTAMVDRNGNTTILSYTGSNLTRITDAVGRSINLEYRASLITRATDPLGRVWRYTYDPFRLRTVTDPMGFTTTYGYEFGPLLTSVTDGRGFVMKKITYSSDIPRVVKQEFADGGFETYEYKFAGSVVSETRMTDSLGRVMTKRFNAAGYVVGEVDGLGQASTIERDMLTNVAKRTTGPCGCPEATRTFDARGNVQTFTDRRGQKTEYEYDANFTFVTLTKDALGRITRMTYDNKGNRVSMTDALGRVTTYAYDGFGQLTSMTDPLGHTMRYAYDANGYVSKITDANNNETSIEFDAIGRLKAITDALGRNSMMDYDDSDRIASETDPAGIVRRYEYDESNNRTAIVNAQNKRWTFVYDGKNRLVKNTDPLNRTTQYRYNTDDELVAMVSPSGRTMRYEYDHRGQRTKTTDPLRGEVRFTYDNRKNLTTLTDERGSTTTYTYDELYRLIAKRDPLGRSSTFDYDPVGNLTQMVDRLNRTTRFDYDPLNRPLMITYVDATVGYAFDEAGRLTRITDSQAGAIEWTYDDANRMLAEKTGASAVDTVSYTYNKADQRAAMSAANRPVVNYDYDTAGRLKTITQGAETFTWSYDDLSRIKDLRRPNNVTTAYSYDAADKLRRLTHTNASGIALEDLQYSYNPDNEIEAIASLVSGTLLPTAKAFSVADAANRIPRFGQAAYTFDEEGQTRTKTDNQGTATYDWDARGRLNKVTLPNGQTVSYNYDALGRRNSRAASGLTTTFLYDGLDVVLDRSSSGLLTDYLNGLGVDNKLRQAGAGLNTLYFLQDHLNSTIGLTNASGNLVEQLRYEAYGAGANSALTRYGYTGRERDALTGLTYYRARWYDQDAGRFLSEDPLRNAETLLGPNLYRYVHNDPINAFDPDGRQDVVPKYPSSYPPRPPMPAGGLFPEMCPVTPSDPVWTPPDLDTNGWRCLTLCLLPHGGYGFGQYDLAIRFVIKGVRDGFHCNCSASPNPKLNGWSYEVEPCPPSPGLVCEEPPNYTPAGPNRSGGK